MPESRLEALSGLLLLVVLDRLGRAQLRLVGVEAGVTARAPLPKEVPVAVELDPDRLEPHVLIPVEAGPFLGQLEEAVLLADELLYVLVNSGVVHRP